MFLLLASLEKSVLWERKVENEMDGRGRKMKMWMMKKEEGEEDEGTEGGGGF